MLFLMRNQHGPVDRVEQTCGEVLQGDVCTEKSGSVKQKHCRAFFTGLVASCCGSSSPLFSGSHPSLDALMAINTLDEMRCFKFEVKFNFIQLSLTRHLKKKKMTSRPLGAFSC
ncbi:hypothetical protein MHYP_G00087020 [Metynnis hypsauchen]